MKKMVIKMNNLNQIVNFIESNCENLDIKNLHFANIIMAVTEMINIITKFGYEGNIELRNSNKEINFNFVINQKIIDFKTVLLNKKKKNNIDVEHEKSILIVMALSDDIKINEKDNAITLHFRKQENDTILSDHRKKYLSNYLGEFKKSVEKSNAEKLH